MDIIGRNTAYFAYSDHSGGLPPCFDAETCKIREAPESLDWHDIHFVKSVIYRSLPNDLLRNLPPIHPSKPPRRSVIRSSSDEDDDPEVPPSPRKAPDIWRLVARLEWADVSEEPRTKAHIQARFDEIDLRSLYAEFTSLAARLIPNLAQSDRFALFDQETQKNIAFHIIAKGHEFYGYAMQCHDIAEYLYDGEWYPLHTWLQL